jgi:hypothetical protein
MLNTVNLFGLILPIGERLGLNSAMMNPEQLHGLIRSGKWKTEDFVLPEGVASLIALTEQFGPDISASNPQEFREEVASLLVRIKFFHYKFDHEGDTPRAIHLTKDDSFPEKLPCEDERIELMKHPLSGDPVYAGYRPMVESRGLRYGDFTINFQLVILDSENSLVRDVREHFGRWKANKH